MSFFDFYIFCDEEVGDWLFLYNSSLSIIMKEYY